MESRQTQNDNPPRVCASDGKTQILSSAVEALKQAAPEGSTVSTVGFDPAELLKMGYRVCEDGGDVVIARGGEREFTEGRKKCAPRTKLILVPTHGYAACKSQRYLDRDGAFSVMRFGATPYAAVFDPIEADDNLASVFGEIISLDLNSFDLDFAAVMRGDPPYKAQSERIAALVAELTANLAPYCKNRKKAAEILTEFGKTAADICGETPELLHCSGAAQTAEALRMLYAAEDRPLAMRGETEMLLSAYVCEFYIKNLSGEPISFPPDNGKRIDRICEYFNADLRRACVFVAPVLPPLKMRICEYRRAEFRNEFVTKIAELRHRQNAAFSVFKRLYRDDGYSLKTMIDKTDLQICLALAPDVFSADTMLSFLKQTGKLDEYIY